VILKLIKRQAVIFFLTCGALCASRISYAQEAASSAPISSEAPQNAGGTADNAPSQPAAPAPIVRVKNSVAVFSGLDKITGRTTSFRIRINETYQFGSLQITPRVCYTNPPNEPVKTDGFVEVNEITLDQKIKRIFTGWMFADSPGLNAVDHPIYDVWLTDCKQK